jgi:hypothetical protein
MSSADAPKERETRRSSDAGNGTWPVSCFDSWRLREDLTGYRNVPLSPGGIGANGSTLGRC